MAVSAKDRYKPGRVLRCNKFPRRHLYLLGRHPFRQDDEIIDGWWVQGYERGEPVGSRYFIAENTLLSSWTLGDTGWEAFWKLLKALFRKHRP